MEDLEKLKVMKKALALAIILIVVLVARMLTYAPTLVRAQNAYAEGWNKCASECNHKIDYYRSQCEILRPSDVIMTLPVPEDIVVGGNMLNTSEEINNASV